MLWGLIRTGVDDVWDASLLHDLGKLDTSRELLHKAERFTASEYEEMKKHVEKGALQIRPVRGQAKPHHPHYSGPS